MESWRWKELEGSGTMTETKFTSKLVKELRMRLPGAMIFKHADGYSAGIPDISISWQDKTNWYEAKLIVNKKIFEPLQLAILKKLFGRYIIWDSKKRVGHIVSAFVAPVDDFGPVYNFNDLVEQVLKEVNP